MKSPPAVKDSHAHPARPRGRPRSEEARRAILQAAHELLKQGGVAAVTIEGIAARAGVGKPTIYRSWPNAHAVAMAALMEGLETPSAAQRGAPPGNADRGPRQATSHASAQASSSASAVAALRDQLREIAQLFSTPLGRNVTLMIASAERETELSKSFRNHFILARRNEGRELLEKAISGGELRRDLDIDITLDLIYAPIFYRLLMGHAPLDTNFIDGVMTHLIEGLGHTGLTPEKAHIRTERSGKRPTR